MKLYVILRDGKPLRFSKANYSPVPLTSEDVYKLMNEHTNDIDLINIIEDLNLNTDDYDLSDYEVQQNILYAWNEKFMNNNINGFSLPIWIECNEDYIPKLKEKFDKYISAIDTPAFRHEKGLLSEIIQICDTVIDCVVTSNYGHNVSKDKMKNFLKKYYNNKFWVSYLGESYALRAIAPFYQFHHTGYEDMYDIMINTPLDLYRMRSEEKLILTQKEDMFHIQYGKPDLIKEHRFSVKNIPCLYLGTTSYNCWEECRTPNFDNIYISGYRPNDKGEKLKLLNLAVSEGLINGIYQKQQNDYNSPEHILQNEMLKIFPIVIATSFSVRDANSDRKKIEYTLSHLIMESLHECQIDGVAYLSNRLEPDLRYPCGVNLAFPAWDINAKKIYSDICYNFYVTTPKKFNDLLDDTQTEQNFISKCFKSKYPDSSVVNYEEKYPNFAKCDNVITNYY